MASYSMTDYTHAVSQYVIMSYYIIISYTIPRVHDPPMLKLLYSVYLSLVVLIPKITVFLDYVLVRLTNRGQGLTPWSRLI